MENSNEPTFAQGKICYVEIPAVNIRESADFYKEVFGWQVNMEGDDFATFDDGVGVSGMWVLDRKPSADVGTLVSIMVDDAEATLTNIIAHGGRVVEPIGQHAPEIMAKFSDPAGNILRIYQHRG